MSLNYSITPTILTPSFEELEKKLGKAKGLCRAVQIDFCDGIFVGNKTWPHTDGGAPGGDNILPFSEEFNFEFDLMIENPDVHIDAYLEMNPASVVLHVESTSEDGFLEAAEAVHEAEAQVGVSSSNSTDPRIIKERGRKLEALGLKPFIQVMGINKVGFKGQPFDGRSLVRIAEFRREFPDVDISVDGAVNEETITKFKDAGANRFVIGSALFEKDDIGAALKNFYSLIK